MNFFSTKALQLSAVFAILRRFQNPFLVILLRVGFIKMPYFPYRLRNGTRVFTMLARPTTTSMADLFVLREVLLDETYRDVLPFLKRGQLRVVDIGANLGSFTLWLHHKAGIREAHCFEPEPDSFRLLQFNLSKNDCSFAQTYPFAIGGEERTAQISLSRSSPGASSIYRAAPKELSTTTIRVASFEQWLKGLNGNFDLLKMDCEGAEWEIIQKTDPKQLRRFNVFVAEVHGDPLNKNSIQDFKPLIEGVGFRTIRWDAHAQGLYVGVRDSQDAQ